MANEELINELVRHKQEMQNDFGWNTTLQTALDAAIKTLKVQLCEDAVSREDVITIIARKHLFKDKSDFDKCVHTIAKQVKALPCVRPEMRTGEWKIGGYNDDFYVCDCGFAYVGLLQKYNYCPHCGARMDGDMCLEDE